MVFKSIIGATCACLAVVSFGVNAALVGRLAATPGGTDYQAYYDTDADLTWLADANYAATSGYSTTNATGEQNSSITNIQADGRMGWGAANAWAAGLDIDGVTGWRLPDTIDVGNDGGTYTNYYQGVDVGYNITTHSEMSNMFYNVLGNLSYFDTNGNGAQPGWGFQNIGPFSNVQSFLYWSATEYAPNTNDAWLFVMSNGLQGYNPKNISLNGWAVHDGDVGAVPIPAAIWLFGSGLIGLIGFARRKPRN